MEKNGELSSSADPVPQNFHQCLLCGTWEGMKFAGLVEHVPKPNIIRIYSLYLTAFDYAMILQ
jgi:hypothetical protein